MPKTFCVSIVLLGCGLAVAVGQSQSAALTFSRGRFVSSVELSGKAVWHYGSDKQTGTAKLEASANGQSRVELQLDRGTRVETQNAFTDSKRACTWSGLDGVVHTSASHNCWLGTVWFLPQITLQPGAGAVDAAISQVVTKDGRGRLHHERHPKDVKDEETAKLLAGISASDLEIDPETGCPQILLFNSHPDNDAGVNIATEIHFSDYRNIEGVAIPFHIQKFVNHSLVLDLQIADVRLQ